jgi:16S rRNA (uracil1498-N3)-methyltransferase
MPVYFIQAGQIQGQRIVISGELAHHLRNVLRVRAGEILRLVDEQPRRYRAEVVGIHPTALTLTLLEEEAPPSELDSDIHLGVGLVKSEQMDWLLQKATELGVSRISPLVTRRSVPLRDERSDHQHHRWQRIVIDAAQQSCRWNIPTVEMPVAFEKVLLDSPSDGLNLIFTDTEGRSDLPHTSAQPVTLLVGPAGGWEGTEIEAALNAGYRPCSLGPRTLRSETAALAALAVVQYVSRKWNRTDK